MIYRRSEVITPKGTGYDKEGSILLLEVRQILNQYLDMKARAAVSGKLTHSQGGIA